MPKNNNQNASRGMADRPTAQGGRPGGSTTGTAPAAGARPGEPAGAEHSGWRETMSDARDRIETLGSDAGQTIGENPMVSILTGFGIGLGVGFILARALAPPEPSWTDRAQGSIADAFDDLRHSLRDLPHMTAERLSSAFRR